MSFSQFDIGFLGFLLGTRGPLSGVLDLQRDNVQLGQHVSGCSRSCRCLAPPGQHISGCSRGGTRLFSEKISESDQNCVYREIYRHSNRNELIPSDYLSWGHVQF